MSVSTSPRSVPSFLAVTLAVAGYEQPLALDFSKLILCDRIGAVFEKLLSLPCTTIALRNGLYVAQMVLLCEIGLRFLFKSIRHEDMVRAGPHPLIRACPLRQPRETANPCFLHLPREQHAN
jgi:hypothetical protein